jgi:hypothetical protein
MAAWCNISFSNTYSNPLYFAHNLYLNGALVTDLVIPDGVTSIGSYAFYNCTSLTSVTLPSGVTSIGSYAFYNCSKLTSVVFENASNWYCASSSSATSGTDIASEDLENTSTAVTYLAKTYSDKYWKRNE